MKNGTTKIVLAAAGLYGLLMAHNDLVANPSAPVWAKLIPVFVGAALIFWLSRKWMAPGLGKIISVLFMGLGRGLEFLFFGLSRWRGARFMDVFESASLLQIGQKGWLIDGKSRRLSEKVSFQSIMTVAGVGAGKTSTFVFPNIFTLKNCSLVITDTSGEIYQQSSGYLKAQGFEIVCLNLMDMSRSHGYNPLHNAKTFTDIAKLAHLIIRASDATGNDRDQFWSAGAETIVRVIIQCLKNKGDEEQCTLGLVKQLLNQFDHFTENEDSQFDRFIMESTLDDQSTWEAYKGFLTGPEKTVLSFISTANTALMALGNPELVRLTENHQIEFARLRKKKIALFVMARQQDMSGFSFILNAFYTDLFHSLLHELNSSHLPVYALLDEFGQLYIPDFSVVATTARKYKLAFWLFLQSQAQLEVKYGRAAAQTIVDGLGTEIYLAGTGLETAERLSRRMGRKRPNSFQPKIKYEDGALMNPDEIISMRDREALMFYGNKRPLKYRTKPYFKHWTFLRHSKMPAAPLPYLSDLNQPTDPSPSHEEPSDDPTPESSQSSTASPGSGEDDEPQDNDPS